MYYVLRRTRYQYEITKFEDRSEPADTYTIDPDKCFCPARIKNCKHMRIFKQWQKDDMPLGVIYDNDAKRIGSLFQ